MSQTQCHTKAVSYHSINHVISWYQVRRCHLLLSTRDKHNSWICLSCREIVLIHSRIQKPCSLVHVPSGLHCNVRLPSGWCPSWHCGAKTSPLMYTDWGTSLFRGAGGASHNRESKTIGGIIKRKYQSKKNTTGTVRTASVCSQYFKVSNVLFQE